MLINFSQWHEKIATWRHRTLDTARAASHPSTGARETPDAVSCETVIAWIDYP
jgi:hypothetical protein